MCPPTSALAINKLARLPLHRMNLGGAVVTHESTQGEDRSSSRHKSASRRMHRSGATYKPLIDQLGQNMFRDLVRFRGIANLSELLPRYEWMGQLASRTLIDAGVLKSIENLRVLPRGFELPALAVGADLTRSLSGPSALTGVIAAEEAHRRAVALTENPAWVRMMRDRAELFRGLGDQVGFSQISDVVRESISSFARLQPIWELQRPVSIGTQAWNELLRQTSKRGAKWEPDRVFASGRATAGIVSSGLALLDDEEAASEDAQELLARDALGNHLRQALASIHPDLTRRLDGAWERISRPGPDSGSQAAHSLMELLDWTLRLAAPNDEVLAWHDRENRSAKELHEGKPTRSLRAKYILRDRSADTKIARMYLRSLSELSDIIEGHKHGLGASDVDAVKPLLPTVEGLLVFLFVSDR